MVLWRYHNPLGSTIGHELWMKVDDTRNTDDNRRKLLSVLEVYVEYQYEKVCETSWKYLEVNMAVSKLFAACQSLRRQRSIAQDMLNTNDGVVSVLTRVLPN